MKVAASPHGTRALRTALATCAGCSWMTAAIVLVDDVGAAWPRAFVCIAALIFGPLYESHLTDFLRRVPRVGPVLSRLVWMLEVLPILFLPVGIGRAFAFGVAMLAQGHLFLLAAEDRLAVYCLVLAPLLAIAALVVVQSPLLLVMVPASGLAALVALALLHGRMARGEVRRTRPAEEGRGGRRARLRYAVWVGAFFFSATLVSFLLLDRGAALVEHRPDRVEVAKAETEEDDSTPKDGQSQLRNTSWDEGRGDLTLSAPAPFSDFVVMEVYPAGGGSAVQEGQPLFLRNSLVDRFHEGGIGLADRSSPPEFTDGSDGRRDGWTSVRDAPDSERTMRLSVLVFVPRVVEEKSWTLLFSPHPLSAVSLPRVRYSPDSVFVSRTLEKEPFSYDLKCAQLEFERLDLSGAEARHPDTKYTQLPPASPSLAAVETAAREVMRRARSDDERVRRVLSFFREDFEYGFDDLGFQGIRAIAAFLENRRGFCTQFASAAALMLRTQGIAARVATGYLAEEWSPADRGYLVRERNAHAWVEVHFEGVGWVTLDPTARARGQGNPLAGEKDAGWFARLSDRLEQWSDSGGVGRSLAEVVAAVVLTPLSLLAHPTAWLLVMAAVLALLHLRAKRRNPKAASRAPLLSPAAQLYDRLVRTLAELGYRRRSAQTPREFARTVATVGGAPFGELRPIVELFYRARFGGTPLSDEEERLVERFLAHLSAEAGASELPKVQ